MQHRGGRRRIDDDQVHQVAQFLDAVSDHEGVGDLDGDAARFYVGRDNLEGAAQVFVGCTIARGIGRAQDLLEGGIAHEEIVEAGRFLDTEGEGGVALRVGIQQDDAAAVAG